VLSTGSISTAVWKTWGLCRGKGCARDVFTEAVGCERPISRTPRGSKGTAAKCHQGARGPARPPTLAKCSAASLPPREWPATACLLRSKVPAMGPEPGLFSSARKRRTGSK
jgi:hypothetical protein